MLTIPSYAFGTLPTGEITAEQRIQYRQLIDKNVEAGLLAGVSYVVDQPDFIERVGYIPPVDTSRPPQMWALPRGPVGYICLGGGTCKVKDWTATMKARMSSSAQQFYWERPELVVPILHGSSLIDTMNITPVGMADPSDFREFPIVQVQDFAAAAPKTNWGNWVLWIDETSRKPVWAGVDEAMKLLPAHKYATPTTSASGGSGSGMGDADKAAAVATMRQLTIDFALRQTVANIIGGQSATTPGLFEKLIGNAWVSTGSGSVSGSGGK